LVLKDLVDYPTTRAKYERALRIDEATFGPDHPKVVDRLDKLSDMLQAQGDQLAARTASERALAIQEKQLGPNHYSVAIRYHNLGILLKDQGDYPAARAAYERSLAIWEEQFGPNDSFTRNFRKDLDALDKTIKGNHV